MDAKKLLLVGGILAAATCAVAQDGMDFGDMGGMGDMDMGGMGGGDGEDIDPAVLEQLMAQMNGGGGMDGGGMDMNAMMGGMGGMGGMGAPREIFKPVKKDIKYILCQTCENLVTTAFDRTAELRASTPKSLFSEDMLDGVFEDLCNTMSSEGTWITQLDMQEKGDEIELEKQEGPGKCKEECKTVEAACTKLMDVFSTDLIAQLYLGKLDRNQLTNEMCHKQTKRLKGSCSKPRPKVKEDREPGGDNFELKSEHQLSMDSINQNFRKEHPDLAAPKHMVDEL